MKKEHILSGLSGINFEHMKACAMGDVLSDFEATICHIPYSTGFSPKKWKKSINTMIQKSGKQPEVEKLRTINLLKYDFNFNNIIMGRVVGEYEERNNLLPKEQYGSRKRHQARHQGLNKRPRYDKVNFQRKPMILCSNHAKSYYDQIIHAISSMTM